MSISRFKTFSPALDKILGGGLPRSSLILFEVSPGTYAWHYAVKVLVDGLNEGDLGIYLTFDHSPNLIRNRLKSFDWDVAESETARRFFIVNAFRWGEKEEKYVIKDPSNDGELVNVFATIRDNASSVLLDKCRCVVDSTIALFFNYGAAKMVSFALLLREVSVKLGITSILISPMAIGRRINDILAYNSDVVIEFKEFEEGERLVSKMRVKKMLSRGSSSWIPYTLSGNKISIEGD
jgi:KaiC/GvpD/RAD55 family RecA-like ATPase